MRVRTKMNTKDVKNELQQNADTNRGLLMQRYFKTGKGQYGEGDVFIGISMPIARKVAKQFKYLSLSDVQKLLDSKIHEERMVALLILVLQFQKANSQNRQKIYNLYIKNVYKGRVNNWDLVDVTTPNIVGEYLVGKPHDILYELAASDSIWQKRVSTMATFAFIKRGNATDTLKIAKILLHDNHDLIHKAVGWMLREVGCRVDQQLLTNFLDNHAAQMPRTMLRYSLEKLPFEKKLHYMRLKD